ncbi:MAG: histidine kinase [Acidobacteria bacterium]|nr:histidine kinase [Acidobacteriota bacterium]
MTLLDATSIVVFTIGAYGFAAAFVLDVAGRRPPPPGPSRSPAALGTSSVVGFALTGVSAVWFVVNLLAVLTGLAGRPMGRELAALLISLSLAYPPLIAHTFVVETLGTSGARPRPVWRWALFGLWTVASAVAALTLSGLYGGGPVGLRLPGGPGPWMAGLFISSGVVSWLALSRQGEPRATRRERSVRRGFTMLLAVLVAVFGLILLGMMGIVQLRPWVELAARSLPLAFLAVGAWHESRFEFYDVLVKRGLFVLCTLALIVAWAAWALPRLETLPTDVAPWITGLGLLPLALVLPWLSRQIARWLDHVWLGRHQSPVEALTTFVSALQRATTETDLVREAQRGLDAIFLARVRIVLDDASLDAGPSERASSLVLPVQAEAGRAGRVEFGPRIDERPFFSEDVVLARSLVDVFGFLLANARLRARRLEQDRLARELSLAASQSELKALRAQVNPHFLFNALNAIAGLIPADPVLADRTVERLADVFRYTLHGSESEWARFADEIAFVGACLDIERARFGPRLTTDVVVDRDVDDWLVPTLIVHTIVENAVKHGVAAVPGPARIEVRACAIDGHLRVEVADTGPGFDAAGGRGAARAPGLGYGLRNVRERLRGHFGDRAGVTWSRDDARQMTVVTLTIPPDRDALDAVAAPGSVREGTEKG